VSCLIGRLLLSLISIVGNVCTFTLPADIALFCFLGRIEKYLFPFLVSAFILEQIYNVESVGLITPCVLDFEIEPLCEALSAIIVLEE
jgi:hypothetical protein